MKYLLALSLVWITSAAIACDVCGCSVLDTRPGVLPDLRTHILGVTYTIRGFDSHHPSLFNDGLAYSTEEHFETYQLQFRTFLWKKLILSGAIPYQSFRQVDAGREFGSQGIGDVQVGLNYLWTRNGATSRNLDQLMPSVVIKLPTGSTDYFADNSGVFNPNMQMGSGSTDVLAGLRYLRRRGKWAQQLQGGVRINTTGANDYRFGNRFTASAQLMRWWSDETERKSIWISSIGLDLVHAERDLLYSSRDVVNVDSGGQQVTAMAGLSLFSGALGMNVRGDLPVWQQLAGGNVEHRFSAEVSFILLIRQG